MRRLVIVRARMGFLLTALILFSLVAFAQTTLQSIQAKTDFQEHTYQRISGPTDACQGDFLDLKYEQADGEIVLHLGERFIFADIGEPGYTDNTEPGCTLKVTTTPSKGEIVQKSVNTCQDPTKGFHTIQVLKLEMGHLVYLLNRRTGDSKNPSSALTCVFEEAKPQAGR